MKVEIDQTHSHEAQLDAQRRQRWTGIFKGPKSDGIPELRRRRVLCRKPTFEKTWSNVRRLDIDRSQ